MLSSLSTSSRAYVRLINESVQRENEMKSMIRQLTQLVKFQKIALLNATTEKVCCNANKISVEQKDASTYVNNFIDDDSDPIASCEECIQKTNLLEGMKLQLNKKGLEYLNLKKEVKKLKQIINKSQSVIDAQEEFINNTSRFRLKSSNIIQSVHNFKFNDDNDNNGDIINNNDNNDDIINNNDNNDDIIDNNENFPKHMRKASKSKDHFLLSGHKRPPLPTDFENNIQYTEENMNKLNSNSYTNLDLIDLKLKNDNDDKISISAEQDSIELKNVMTECIISDNSDNNETILSHSIELKNIMTADDISLENYVNKSWTNNVTNVDDSFTLIQQYYMH
jgi:hypothetical protein